MLKETVNSYLPKTIWVMLQMPGEYKTNTLKEMKKTIFFHGSLKQIF
jgi:hypothetical protein